jgi:hypothetical protein
VFSVSRHSGARSKTSVTLLQWKGCGQSFDALLEQWVPYPPRVEVSALGEAAVLTGALSVGVGRALDSVFVNRASPPRAVSAARG